MSLTQNSVAAVISNLFSTPWYTHSWLAKLCSEDKLHKQFFTSKTYNLLVSLGYITYINCILGVEEGMSQLIILLFLGFLYFSLSFFPYFYFLSRTQIHKRVTAQVFPFSHPILPSTSSSSGPCFDRWRKVLHSLPYSRWGGLTTHTVANPVLQLIL